MPFRARSALAAFAVLALAASAGPARAQRPFSIYDPFYRSESARRAFHDGYALTGEVSYAATDRAGASAASGTTAAAAVEPDPLGLALRFDYGLSSHLDVGAILDASGVGSGRALRWGWVVGRYYWTVDDTDYSFRLALDPDSDGRVGFPQADLAFVSTAPLSPRVSSDFALGFRRVRRGFQDVAPRADAASPLDPLRDYDVQYGRAIGWEIHVMTTYDVLLGPSGSRVFAGLAADRGAYEIVTLDAETPAPASAATARAAPLRASVADDPAVDDNARSFRGGVVWLRAGVDLARPSFRVAPFVGLPIAQWTPAGAPRSLPQIGLEVTLR